MFQLDTISSTTKRRKRIGRGRYRGGTSGKGHKGQKARSGGKVRSGFEGGQMPLYRRLPKRGFNNTRFRQTYCIVNLHDIEKFFQADELVNFNTLMKAGLIRPKKGSNKGQALIKILGNQISKSFTIQAHAYSQAARQAIESIGGKAELSVA